MNNGSKKEITLPYLAHAHRQHNSLVTVIPKGICHALDIEASDILLFELHAGCGYAKFKLQMKGPAFYAKSGNDTGGKDKGGGI